MLLFSRFKYTLKKQLENLMFLYYAQYINLVFHNFDFNVTYIFKPNVYYHTIYALCITGFGSERPHLP